MVFPPKAWRQSAAAGTAALSGATLFPSPSFAAVPDLGFGPGAVGLAAGVAAVALAVAGLMVGQRRRAEHRAAEAEAREAELAAIVDAAAASYCIWNRDGGEERCSPCLTKLLGLEAGDQPSFDAVLAHLRPEDAGRLAEAVEGLKETGEPFRLTLERADGDRWFLAEGSASRDAHGRRRAALWLSDVTALGAQIRAAHCERDRLRQVLDAVPFPIWRRKSDLTLAWCNRAYADIVEADPEAALADGGIELVAGIQRDRGRGLAETARDGGRRQTEDFHVVAGGQRRLLRTIETPLGTTGETVGAAFDMTELEKARDELHRHLEAYAEVLEHLQTPIATFGPDARLNFFNGAYARLSRLGENWLATHPSYGEILEALREKRRMPEMADFPAFKRQQLELFTSLTEPFEDVLHLPDGRTLRSVITPHPLGGLVVTVEDVTDRLALERSLNTLIAVQRATLDNLFEGVAVFGSDGRLKLSNPGFAQLWDLRPEDLENEPHIADILERTKKLYLDRGDWPSYKAAVIAHTTERTPRRNRLERRNGTVLECASVPLPDGATLMTYLDITDSVQVERALRERAEALEEADRLKSEFIANVSYELRTPLNAVIGFSEILTGQYFGKLNPHQLEYFQGILGSSQYLLGLINNILDLATIEAGHMMLEIERFDVQLMLTGVINLVHRRLREKNLSLDLHCPADIGEMEADERRIKQVVFNLLTNAIKFTPEEGRITVKAERDRDEIRIAVADTGPGICAEDQHRLFEKFHRGADTSPHAGTGLGLVLVKSFVALHGGRVELHSRPNEGTRVICHLPGKANVPQRAQSGLQ